MSTILAYRVFVAVVEQNSLSKAAKVLNMSPSSVSKQLRKLEDGLDVQLIDRSTLTLSVTPAGNCFYEDCKEILLKINEAERQVKNEQKDLKGRITVSFSRVLLNSPLFDLLTKFNRQNPDIVFELLVEDDIENLVSKKIDFTFRINTPKDSRLVYIPLMETKMMVCASPDYLKHHGDPNKKRNVENQRIVFPSYLPDHLVNEVLKATKSDHLKNRDNHHFINDVNSLVEAGISGMGVIASLDVSVKRAIEEGTLVELFPKIKKPGRTLSLVYHKRSHMPQYLTIFKEFVRDNFVAEMG